MAWHSAWSLPPRVADSLELGERGGATDCAGVACRGGTGSEWVTPLLKKLRTIATQMPGEFAPGRLRGLGRTRQLLKEIGGVGDNDVRMIMYDNARALVTPQSH